ncbi:MAG: HEPN domain-containing protein, partial [Pirellulales bacterium]
MKRMTREWIRKAEDDFQAAVILAAEAKSLHDPICFHCQQSAEKYLKALLEELGLVVPRTHDLENLLALLRPHYVSLRRYRRGLRSLKRFAVEPRLG